MSPTFPQPSHPAITRTLAAVFLLAATQASATLVLVDPEKADPPGMVSPRLLPPKPASRVLDAAGSLSAEAGAELAAKLAAAAADGIEIHTVILDGPSKLDPTKLGNELVLRWTPPGAEIGVLVLSLPTAGEEPLVFIRTHLFEEVGTPVFSALGQAALGRSTDPGGSRPAAPGVALELATGLGEVLSRVREARAASASAEESKSRKATGGSIPAAVAPPEVLISHWDLFVAGLDPRMMTLLRDCALGTGGLVLLGATLIAMRLRRPRLFPQVEFRRRFSAPYAGGNNARAETSRPEPPVHVPHG